MAKVKTIFYCQSCGNKSPKWLGKCTTCNEWNTYVEEVVAQPKSGTDKLLRQHTPVAQPHKINDIIFKEEERIVTTDTELNRVLGGGIVPGALILFGGEPGIGKSTLLLQFCLKIQQNKILYVSGEESEKQIKMRADRIGIENEECFIYSETSLEKIVQQAQEMMPDILVIDSIQTVHTGDIESSAGSVSQIRECTAQLMRFAKNTGIPIFLIGHINKEGSIAGPKVLEHMVDTVLQFEGDRNFQYRLLRTTKNRFGASNELGLYEMLQSGLKIVENPTDVLVSNNSATLSGTAVASTIEGIRPLLIEVQALVSTAAYGTPQRSATGFDLKRLNMLLAVLEKRCSFKLGAKDVFLNISGGIKVDDPAIDLAVISAVLSSNADLAIGRKICLAGEISLAGEVRSVTRVNQRIAEAQKMGYQKIIISKYNKGVIRKDDQIEICEVAKIEDVLKNLFH